MRAAIIGAGAAGLTAAIFAKRTFPWAEITVFDGNERVGKKILSTGNGRCNLSNENISAKNYMTKSPQALEAALSGRGFEFVRAFFGSLGVPFVIEDGRAYPRSMRAAAVVDALRFECARLGVRQKTGCRVNTVALQDGAFYVNGEKFHRLVLASGGKAAPSTGSDGFGLEVARNLGHTVTKCRPALVQLRTEGAQKSLHGLRARARAKALINGECVREETGEVQFCDYGLSGIPILQLSGLFNESMEIELDLLPEHSFSKALSYALDMAQNVGDLALTDFFGGIFHKSLTALICARCGLDKNKTANELTIFEMKQFIRTAKALRFRVTGTRDWGNAQTTRGGVSLSETEPLSMESARVKGLFFAGELLDVCGDCGGYNLHWAWVSGSRAGENLFA